MVIISVIQVMYVQTHVIHTHIFHSVLHCCWDINLNSCLKFKGGESFSREVSAPPCLRPDSSNTLNVKFYHSKVAIATQLCCSKQGWNQVILIHVFGSNWSLFLQVMLVTRLNKPNQIWFIALKWCPWIQRKI